MILQRHRAVWDRVSTCRFLVVHRIRPRNTIRREPAAIPHTSERIFPSVSSSSAMRATHEGDDSVGNPDIGKHVNCTCTRVALILVSVQIYQVHFMQTWAENDTAPHSVSNQAWILLGFTVKLANSVCTTLASSLARQLHENLRLVSVCHPSFVVRLAILDSSCRC